MTNFSNAFFFDSLRGYNVQNRSNSSACFAVSEERLRDDGSDGLPDAEVSGVQVLGAR